MSVRLERITIFPIKSLDGMSLRQAKVRCRAGLANDRRWAIVDMSGRFVTGKRNARVHRIRARFSDDLTTVRLALERDALPEPLWGADSERRIPRDAAPDEGHSRSAAARKDPEADSSDTADATAATGAHDHRDATPGEPVWESFELDVTNARLKEWLSAALGERVELVENPAAGFPDDENFNGPTVISTETLRTVAEWFPGLTLAEARRRFRANLELGGAGVAFWEDRLYGPTGVVIPFRIGSVRLGGCNPCRRCVVPTRDSRSGRPEPGFVERFRQMRAATLPSWAERSRFDHHYRLAVNTIVLDPGTSGVIAVGDEVVLERADGR